MKIKVVKGVLDMSLALPWGGPITQANSTTIKTQDGNFSTTYTGDFVIPADTENDPIAGTIDKIVNSGEGNKVVVTKADLDAGGFQQAGNDADDANDTDIFLSFVFRDDDRFILGGGNDEVYSGRGDDIIDCGSGNDSIEAGRGNDIIMGGRGKDRIDGGSGKDTIEGGGGRDVLDGDGGRDLIRGGAGNDFIEGDEGNDILWGDAGSDVFFFNENDGKNVIMDFSEEDLLFMDSDVWGGGTLTRKIIKNAREVVDGDTVLDFGTIEITLADIELSARTILANTEFFSD